MNARTTIPTAATPDVCTVEILVDGQALPGTLQVQSVTVGSELNRIPWATVQIEDGQASQATFQTSSADTFLPGKTLEIQFGYRSDNQTVFKGVIVKQRIRVRKNGSVLCVECFSGAIKSTAAARSRYYTDMKDSDIMEQILDALSLQREVEATAPVLKEVVQFDSTDWDFLLCRAEANGQVVLVEDDKITIRKPAMDSEPVLELAYGSTVLELDAELDARWQSKNLKASSWKAADQSVIEAEAAEPAAPQAGNISAADLASVMGDQTSEIRHAGAIDEPQLQTWADARLLRMRLARLRGRAKCQGFAGVRPDTVIRITGIGERFEGTLYVSGVRHTVAGGNWESDVQFGLAPELFAQTFELRPPPAAGLLPAANGLQIGVVTALENDPDGEDRIKCRLPMVGAGEEGLWARLATLDAGDGRGTYFRPEIGDEVVVGFLDDDPRHPVILGMCHSSAKPAPEQAKDDNHLKGYVSRSGIKLTFDDENKISTIETPAGNKIVLSDNDQGITLEDQNGNRIVLDASGITIKSAKDMIFEAAKDVKLTGINTEFSANQSFKASGTASAELSGSQTSITGDATTVIKGGLVQIN